MPGTEVSVLKILITGHRCAHVSSFVFYFIKLKKLFLSSPSYSSKTLPYIGMVWKDEYGMQNKFIVCTTSIIGMLSIVCSPKREM